MAGRSRKALGLAVGTRSIVVAEVRIGGGRREIARVAEYVFAEGLSWDEPAPLGRALALFLRHGRFSARRAVFGLPTDWLLARDKSVPPASRETLAGILQIQAESDFATDSKDLALDYAGEPDESKGRSVLMVATLRRRMEQVAAAADSAGLDVVGVTSAAMVLSQAGGAGDACRLVLSLKPESAELTAQAGDRFYLARHITLAASADPESKGVAASVASEVRRALSALPEGDERGTPSLIVWDGAREGTDIIKAISEQTGMEACAGDLRSILGFTAVPDVASKWGARADQAAALALAGTETRLMPVDFLHSRLAVKKKSALGRRALAGTMSAVVVLGAVGWAVADWYYGSRDITQMKTQLTATDKDLTAATDMVAKVRHAREWYRSRPVVLDCLKDVTLAFPERGGIWVTTFSILPPRNPGEKGLQGMISGNATDQRTVEEMTDRLMRSRSFKDVQRIFIREAARGSREVTFSLKFSYSGTE